MKRLSTAKLLATLAIWTALSAASIAEEPGCVAIGNMATMASAKTLAALTLSKQKAGNSYRAQLIFAARRLQLNASDKEAAAIFMALLPKTDLGPRQRIWLDLVQLDSCAIGRVSINALKRLSILQDHLPRLAAKAVILVPDKMSAYVAYGLLATWPDSDYAVQMRGVCRARHKQFVEAVNGLDVDDKKFFLSKIFNPEGCRTIFYPEL